MNERITRDPARMGGVPCVRDTRIPVATIVAAYADGLDDAAIIAEHPDLTPEDLAAAVEFAVEVINGPRRSREVWVTRGRLRSAPLRSAPPTFCCARCGETFAVDGARAVPTADVPMVSVCEDCWCEMANTT